MSIVWELVTEEHNKGIETPVENPFVRALNLFEDDENERAERRRQRLADCGQSACRLDPHTGKHYWFTQKCGLFRECPKCLAERADKIKEQMYDFIKDGNAVSGLRLTEKEAKSLARKLDKDLYEKYPQLDGSELAFVKTDMLPKALAHLARPVEREDVYQINWIDIALTPEGRNKSGCMTTSKETSEDEETFAFVNSPSIVSDAPASEQERALEIARHKTNHLDPHTADEVEDALQERMWEAYRILKASGYNPRIYHGMVKVITSRISWLNFNSVKREKQHKEPLENQARMWWSE